MNDHIDEQSLRLPICLEYAQDNPSLKSHKNQYFSKKILSMTRHLKQFYRVRSSLNLKEFFARTKALLH